MHSVGAGWLMTSLTRDAFVVSLVQVASALPMFMFALAGGALSDIVDKRRLLIAGEVAIAILSAIFAAMVWLNYVDPRLVTWVHVFHQRCECLHGPRLASCRL